MGIIVELENGVYLTDGDGDPARTIVKRNAKQFKSKVKAARAITSARKYRPFEHARIIKE